MYSVVLHILREKYGLSAFEDRMKRMIFIPRREEVREDWRNIHN